MSQNPKCQICKGTGKIIIKKPGKQTWMICRHCKPEKGKLICV